MDLYKFYSKPEALKGYDEADDIVPSRILKLAKSGKKLTDKQEVTLAKNAEHSYSYAYILKKPFPKGEDAIAKDAQYSYIYANDVLKKPFPKGEDAIAKDSYYSYLYARYVLKNPFPQGEKQ